MCFFVKTKKNLFKKNQDRRVLMTDKKKIIRKKVFWSIFGLGILHIFVLIIYNLESTHLFSNNLEILKWYSSLIWPLALVLLYVTKNIYNSFCYIMLPSLIIPVLAWGWGIGAIIFGVIVLISLILHRLHPVFLPD